MILPSATTAALETVDGKLWVRKQVPMAMILTHPRRHPSTHAVLRGVQHSWFLLLLYVQSVFLLHIHSCFMFLLPTLFRFITTTSLVRWVMSLPTRLIRQRLLDRKISVCHQRSRIFKVWKYAKDWRRLFCSVGVASAAIGCIQCTDDDVLKAKATPQMSSLSSCC